MALSLLVEAAILGLVGILAGVLLAFPLAALLIGMGITTTGREPGSGFAVPWPELGGMALLSLLIALLGVLGPVRSLARMRIVEVVGPGLDSHRQGKPPVRDCRRARCGRLPSPQ